MPTLSFPQVLSVFSLSRNQQTAPLPPLSTFLCLWVLVFNYFFDFLLGQWSKPGSHVFASSLTASNTKRTNLTWLPLEIMHHGHTWHDYPRPWVSLTTPRQNVYACARLSISDLFLSHTFQSKSPARFILCAACCSVVLLYAARVFDYFVVIEIAFMDNHAQITETINRLDSEKVRWE